MSMSPASSTDEVKSQLERQFPDANITVERQGGKAVARIERMGTGVVEREFDLSIADSSSETSDGGMTPSDSTGGDPTTIDEAPPELRSPDSLDAQMPTDDGGTSGSETVEADAGVDTATADEPGDTGADATTQPPDTSSNTTTKTDTDTSETDSSTQSDTSAEAPDVGDPSGDPFDGANLGTDREKKAEGPSEPGTDETSTPPDTSGGSTPSDTEVDAPEPSVPEPDTEPSGTADSGDSDDSGESGSDRRDPDEVIFNPSSVDMEQQQIEQGVEINAESEAVEAQAREFEQKLLSDPELSDFTEEELSNLSPGGVAIEVKEVEGGPDQLTAELTELGERQLVEQDIAQETGVDTENLAVFPGDDGQVDVRARTVGAKRKLGAERLSRSAPGEFTEADVTLEGQDEQVEFSEQGQAKAAKTQFAEQFAGVETSDLVVEETDQGKRLVGQTEEAETALQLKTVEEQFRSEVDGVSNVDIQEVEEDAFKATATTESGETVTREFAFDTEAQKALAEREFAAEFDELGPGDFTAEQAGDGGFVIQPETEAAETTLQRQTVENRIQTSDITKIKDVQITEAGDDTFEANIQTTGGEQTRRFEFTLPETDTADPSEAGVNVGDPDADPFDDTKFTSGTGDVEQPTATDSVDDVDISAPDSNVNITEGRPRGDPESVIDDAEAGEQIDADVSSPTSDVRVDAGPTDEVVDASELPGSATQRQKLSSDLVTDLNTSFDVGEFTERDVKFERTDEGISASVEEDALRREFADELEAQTGTELSRQDIRLKETESGVKPELTGEAKSRVKTGPLTNFVGGLERVASDVAGPASLVVEGATGLEVGDEDFQVDVPGDGPAARDVTEQANLGDVKEIPGTPVTDPVDVSGVEEGLANLQRDVDKAVTPTQRGAFAQVSVGGQPLPVGIARPASIAVGDEQTTAETAFDDEEVSLDEIAVEKAFESPATFVVGVGQLGKDVVDVTAEGASRVSEDGVVSGPVSLAEDFEKATVDTAALGASAAIENPAKTAAAGVGSLVGSAILLGGAAAVGPRTGLATRLAVQPAEEIVGIGGFKATRAIAGKGRAQKLFPNKEPLIFSEEAVIRGAQRVGSRAKAEFENLEVEVGSRGVGVGPGALEIDVSRSKTKSVDTEVGEIAGTDPTVPTDVNNRLRRRRPQPGETRRSRREVRRRRIETETDLQRRFETTALSDDIDQPTVQTQQKTIDRVQQLPADAEDVGTQTGIEERLGQQSEIEQQLDTQTNVESRLDQRTEVEQRVGTETEQEQQLGRRSEIENRLDQRRDLEVGTEQETEIRSRSETRTRLDQQLSTETDLDRELRFEQRQELETEFETRLESRSELEAEIEGIRLDDRRDEDDGIETFDLFARETEIKPGDPDEALDLVDDDFDDFLEGL